MTSETTIDVLHPDKHIAYILSLDNTKETFEYWVTEHLRMSGVYWGLSGMFLLGAESQMNRDDLIAFVDSCRCSNGGYGGNIGHDAHILYTLSAIQILAMLDALDHADVDSVVEYKGLQKEDGSFTGDKWGEVDTRFSYTALACLAILDRLDAINVDAATDYVASCRNFDGGFGCTPGAESHAGQTLAIGNAMHHVDADLLGWWLCERQTPGGGLNGRPEKLPDVCYSWWILSSLSIIDRIHWINKDRLRGFILNCQDPEDGGISDRPGDMVDVFHTYFGIGGLSLMGNEEGLAEIDPVYALPVSTVERLGLATRSHRKRP